MMNLLSKPVKIKGNELEEVLKEIQSGQTTWDEKNKTDIVKAMINHIGSTDSELRELIYSSFSQLILDNELAHELLVEILDFCLSDLLFKGIGENGTDTVFTRSFTSLLIELILYKDNENQFLSQSIIYKAKDELIHYINLEQDLRGYVPEKGWAHSVAHVADVCVELVKNEKIEQKYYSEILETLWKKIFYTKGVYIHNEDGRIIRPILAMLNRGLEIEGVEALIKGIPMEMKCQKEELDDEHYLFLKANCKLFLKSFYIEINSNSNLLSLQKNIETCLSEI
ncbi:MULTISPECIES: DUF2785 domain-containing protein [Bacillus]|uniref:DUF2785 domain-containing protein n=1 Tax=Bacillus paramycoides TaxID=2026194 RepID=A0ABU6MZD1_9BACI|nr:MULTISPECIES: DUF2785 domain-containing protein [Bacillus]MED1567885.1 DUF2785 domain-containing protein [Bacillus paramycoides]